jgi:PKD repeat protein
MRMFDAGRPTALGWVAAGGLLLGLALAGSPPQPLHAQSGVVGQWRTLPYRMPINPVHIALTNDGNVLIVAGSGNDANETNYQAAVWDPVAGTIATQPVAWDMFCNGMSVLPDGRVFINGGNLQYDPFFGEPRNAVFDPVTRTFTDVESMAHGRWYPTVTTLGDGSVMSFSGLRETGGTNTAVEIYTMGSGWSAEFPAGWTPPLYPRMHLNTDGRVFYAGSGRGSRFFNPTTKTWTAVIATTNYGGSRPYGTSVLLPLRPSDGYHPRVIIFGGGNPATATTEIIDLSAATPAWQFGPPMSQPRIQMNATILPNGKVLAVGGSTNDEDANTKSLNADLFDPITNTFSSAGANAYARLYHSGSLLLPDATVMLVGGNPTRGSYEDRIEIYSPAYLFKADGTPATRPTIDDVTPGAFGYGQPFLIETPNAASIASVVLVRPGAQTHAIDMEQRLVGLNFTVGEGVLNVTAPPHGNIAPPGYYMLFVLDTAGVPSVARFVRIAASVSNQAPTATINSPATNVTVNPGGTVQFSGTGTDSDGTITGYSWTFPGGAPASASVATPGNVVYSTPGSYTASLSVTDNGGLVSAPATRTITVADFTLSATPSSRTILPGASTTYTATATAGTGFTGTAAFSVTGLPAGATASFSPTSVTPSGTSTLTVATTAVTPPGSYPLTIRGTSGPRTHTASVTLVVSSGTFSITASPASRTVSRDGATTYTVTVPGGTGFVGTIAMSVSGGPRDTNYKFTPTSIVNSGTSTLTVDTRKRVSRGTYTLVIRGTSGSTVRTANVTLIVQ